MQPDPVACTTIPAIGLTPLDSSHTNERVIDPAAVALLGEVMRDFMAITKALADEPRVRMLLALRRSELCLCQIIELVHLAPSTVSRHMSILKQARLVDSRKDGRWIYYRLAGPEAPRAVREAIDWAARSLSHDGQVARDRQQLEAILRMDVQDLCEAKCPEAQTAPLDQASPEV